MGEKAKNFGNRLGNTAMITPRLAGTAVNTASDTVNTLVALPKDALDVIQSTANDIKNVFIDSWTKGKWYQRVGNVILSPVVATGTAIEGAVRTAVTPVVNGVVNGRNTLKNTVKNAWRSSFGRVFSKKPISDFSYDQLKTANIIDKNKNRFSKLQFGKKKKLETNENKDKVEKAAAVVGGVAATAAVVSSAEAKEVAKLKENINTLNAQIANLQVQLKAALEAKKPNTSDGEKTTTKKEENDSKGKEVKEDSKEKKKEKAEKVAEDGKGEKNEKNIGKKEETKSTDEGKEKKVENIEEKENGNKEKKDNNIEKTSEGKEKSEDKNGKEKLDKEAKREGVEKANKLLKNSPCGQEIMNRLCKNYKDFGIIFDNTTCDGRHNENSITVGTKMPGDKNISALAPFNRDIKDKEYQVRHVLLHELAHCTIDSHKGNIPEIQKGLDIIKKYIEKDDNGKTLSTLSYKNDEYKSSEAKAKEDLVEMFALRMNGDGKNCKKYTELLSSDSDEDKNLRQKYGLATISKDDAKELQHVCDVMAKIYEK